MTRPLALSLLLPVLSTGCIIYDGTCGPRGECGWGDGDTSANHEGLDGDSGDDADAARFAIDPAELDAGTVVIASLTAENFDLNTVTGVEAYGDVTLVAAANRGDELLLTLSVDEAAADGTADLLLHVGDDVRLLEDILTVHAAEAGGGDDSGGGADDSGGGGGDDTGSDCG